jgi:hypothetical protein
MAGFYNVQNSVWALTCCAPSGDAAGWQIFSAVFGWNNLAYYSSVLSYIGFWVLLSLSLVLHKLYLRRRKALGYSDDDEADENRVGFKARVKMAVVSGAQKMKAAMFKKKDSGQEKPQETDVFMVAA